MSRAYRERVHDTTEVELPSNACIDPNRNWPNIACSIQKCFFICNVHKAFDRGTTDAARGERTFLIDTTIGISSFSIVRALLRINQIPELDKTGFLEDT